LVALSVLVALVALAVCVRTGTFLELSGLPFFNFYINFLTISCAFFPYSVYFVMSKMRERRENTTNSSEPGGNLQE
jgi:hypothetical protein